MGKIIIKRGDITKEDVDVIVNAANTRLLGGGGVDGAIHKAAGPGLLEECRGIGGCGTGKAVITGPGNIPVKNIIHTPGPVWRGGSSDEKGLLRSCYRECLRLASEHGLRTIAFPSISTGVYRFPIREASYIALSEGLKTIEDFDEIRYVCFSNSDLEVYTGVYEDLVDSLKNGYKGG